MMNKPKTGVLKAKADAQPVEAKKAIDAKKKGAKTVLNKDRDDDTNKKSGGGAADDYEDEGHESSYYGDQQFLDAVDLAIRSKKISTSLLQRKLSIGYGKAAKYVDMMEEIGVVSEPKGQKPRDVLISMDEWHEKLSRVSLD